MEDKAVWKKMDEEAVSPVIGTMLMVLITVGLAGVLCAGVRIAHTGGITPTIGLISTARDNDGNYVNITWDVVSVSRVDIKWSDIKIKCFASGVALMETTTASPARGEFYVSNKPSETYVEGAQTITVEFNADDLGDSAGREVAEISFVYIPTHSIAGMHTVVVPKAKA